MKNININKIGSIFALAITTMLSMNSMQAETIVNDSFTEGVDANGISWWTTTAQGAIEVTEGALGLVSGPVGQGIRGTFEPQLLKDGQSIKATFTFRVPSTIGDDKSSAFRVGLYDKAERTDLEADLSASAKKPNVLYNGLPGYMVDFDVSLKDATKADINIRKHDTSATQGRLLGTTKSYKRLDSGGKQYKFVPNQVYIGTIAVKRIGDSAEISASLSQNTRVFTTLKIKTLSKFSVEDPESNINNIGMLAFHVNSKTFGSSNKKDTPDNGLDFKNIKIERF